MNNKSTAAFLLAGLMVAGLATVSAGQTASAHTFSGDESAAFLVKVDAVKVHMTLVGKNLSDKEEALHHVEHAIMQFDEDTLKEIGEKNERLATDIPAAFDELSTMVEDGEPRSAIAQQMRDISDLLGEAVSVRVESSQLTNSTVQALRVAGLVDEALHEYEQAHGAASDHMHDEAMEDAHDEMAMEDGGSHMSAGIVDSDAYMASKLFTFRAKSIFYRIADDVPQESQAEGTATWQGLVDLRDAVSHKGSLEDVTVLVHTHVHENLGKAFGLKLEGHESEDDHMEGSMEEGHMG